MLHPLIISVFLHWWSVEWWCRPVHSLIFMVLQWTLEVTPYGHLLKSVVLQYGYGSPYISQPFTHGEDRL